MQTEIEAKWLNIDIPKMRKRLTAAGAELLIPERLMTRSVFDYPDKRLQKNGGWVRVRDEGDKVTLSYKQLNDRSLHGTQEVSLVIDSFDNACDFLKSIGLEQFSFQETKRESWKLGETEIELDTWPWIPSLIEVEGKNEDSIRAVAKLLSLDFEKALHGSVETAYQAVYDVTDEEIDGCAEFRFVAVPDWLEAKRK